MQPPRKHCFVNDFWESLWAGEQQREEQALISASLCANLYCAVSIEPAGSTAFATQSCNREHSRHLPLLKPRSGHLNGHIDRRPVTNHPTHPLFFATDGSGDDLTQPCWLVNGALSRHATFTQWFLHAHMLLFASHPSYCVLHSRSSS